ncbi:Aspartate beta-hydroxylase domain-containing protein 2 [Merluccius polli]|uniref:Aspartate beta-hydroxylase domain-containing protein 2 n=1 Tax=Merluccius polli TaxID=89951 RepID=A0AA47N162_MERPO|nr:Aspartate beta-hydroxylase domain-containing protein 2 [Merluccius polli]
MHWWASPFPLPLSAELGFPPLNGLLWPLLLLFLWYCYRMGSDLPPPGRAHPGGWARPPGTRRQVPGARRFMMLSRGSGGGPRGSETASGSEVPRAEQATRCISMETSEDEDPDGREYLTPVPGRPLFPAQASAAGRKLYAALQEYAKRYGWVGMGRIHKGLREQVRLSDHSTIQRPHLFFLPDVPSVPFFPRDAHRHDIELLEAQYPLILAEFQAVYQRGVDSKLGWSGPKGQTGFPLYSAGICVAGNCRSCPYTYRTLLSMRTFISSNSLGGAGFVLLGPGVTLGGSYGPTNARLRCHLGLQTPPLCELVVGGEPQRWSEGHCLLVDDSFLHTISHKGPPEDGPRAIFSVDLWHPNVAAAERQALDYIFNPDL